MDIEHWHIATTLIGYKSNKTIIIYLSYFIYLPKNINYHNYTNRYCSMNIGRYTTYYKFITIKKYY